MRTCGSPAIYVIMAHQITLISASAISSQFVVTAVGEPEVVSLLIFFDSEEAVLGLAAPRRSSEPALLLTPDLESTSKPKNLLDLDGLAKGGSSPA